MDSKRKFSWPIILALALHLTIIGLFALSALLKPDKIEPKPEPEIIHAEIIDETKVKKPAEAGPEPVKQEEETNQETEEPAAQQAEAEKAQAAEQARAEAKQAEIAKAKAQAAEQAKVEAAAKAKAEAERAEAAKAKAAEEKAKAEAAAKAKAEAERAEAAKAKAAEEKAKTEAIAQAKAEAERAEAARMEAEQARMDAEQDQLAIKSSVAAINQKVTRSWIRPVSATEGLKCTIQVRLMSDGTVIDAVVVTSSGDEIFDRSAESAVHKASPLPVPKDKELAAKEFKSFKFLFNPDRSR
ncbi:MAG: cell envelope integrity protein TolA [Methylococcaceae bacterium]